MAISTACWSISQSGMLAVPLLLAALDQAGRPPSPPFAAGLRVLRHTMSLGMLMAWLLGTFLLVHGGWLSAGWMSVKLVIVVALSALHGTLSAQVRRLLAGDYRWTPRRMRFVLAVELGCLAAVAFLVIAKPF